MYACNMRCRKILLFFTLSCFSKYVHMYPGTKNAKKSNFYVHNAQFFTVIALCMYSISSKNGHQKAVFKK
jgi:hypothetical protein